jgi:peptidoglycan/LPS O-acetylase OafA/YrhL
MKCFFDPDLLDTAGRLKCAAMKIRHHIILTIGNAHLPAMMWAPAAVFLVVGSSVVLSVMSFRYFENPARRALSWLLVPQATDQSSRMVHQCSI